MAIADQLSRLNELRQNLAAALTAKNVEAAETEGFETLVPKVAEISSSVCVIKITFDSAFVGQSYTVTDGNGDTKTGIVPESCVDSVSVANCNTTYTISAAANGVTYSTAVTTGAYYGEYTATLLTAKIYGVQWDGTSTTAWTRTDDAALFTDPVPAIGGGSGSSPFDNLQPWAGMVKSERTGGTMVAIPKFWYKITQSGSYIKIQIADKAVSGYSVSPAHMDRGDGKGERDVVYIGRYHCGATAYKSVSGQKPKVSITRADARTAISNLGSTIWQCDFLMRFTIWLLYIVEFANWNSQSKIGYGCGNDSAVQNVGASDSMGYHTGTMQSARTTYGVGTQYRYIEDLWGNCYDLMDGCYYNSSGLNLILNPSSFSDSSGGTAIGVPTSGYPSAFTVKSVSGMPPVFIPTNSNGSDTMYSCDLWDYNASNPCLWGGGSCKHGTLRGLFYVYCNSASYSSENIGCRLQELP